MKILGVNCVYHETSAALIIDGKVVNAAEEERFNRNKHGSEARVDNPDEVPLHSIRYCLEQGGVKPEELDAVCSSFHPGLREQEFTVDPYGVTGDWGSVEGEQTFLEGLKKVPGALSAALGVDMTDRFHWVPITSPMRGPPTTPPPFQRQEF